MTEKSEKSDKPLSNLQIIGSVLASFFGVQNRKNRERDFRHGKAVHFVLAGLLVTLVFVFLVWFAVQMALHQAAA